MWLAHPNDFAGEAHAAVPSFDGWLTEPGSFVLEALQPVLEHRWLEIERTKGQVGDWNQLGQQGQVQGQVIEAFTEAVNRAGRRDLVRFLLAVMSRVLATPDMAPTFWTGGLQGSGPPRLADRLATQRNALAVLRSAERFRAGSGRPAGAGTWTRTTRPASSGWRVGAVQHDRVADRAERVLQQVEPLRIGYRSDRRADTLRQLTDLD